MQLAPVEEELVSRHAEEATSDNPAQIAQPRHSRLDRHSEGEQGDRRNCEPREGQADHSQRRRGDTNRGKRARPDHDDDKTCQ
jgi:hypothetical protein